VHQLQVPPYFFLTQFVWRASTEVPRNMYPRNSQKCVNWDPVVTAPRDCAHGINVGIVHICSVSGHVFCIHHLNLALNCRRNVTPEYEVGVHARMPDVTRRTQALFGNNSANQQHTASGPSTCQNKRLRMALAVQE
jgi:hypothetical protein